ncbi:MAG TPA: amidohydrolase/deacetylase family metallohydrolase [Puia sp.]|jgi:dihydroorotase|nr:amidohydrolase/deacetylase family metallohydrolase [Puia sp.]
MRTLPLLLLFIAASRLAPAQPYTLLIKGGYLIDPKTNLHDTLDIALKDNLIARIAKNIDPRQSKRVIDARGLYVCPGLIDIHTHVFFGSDPDNEYVGGTEAVIPDSIAPREGVTTMVDAGSSGWRNFGIFKKRVIDRSNTRVLAFLNIVGTGMHGEPYEQDTKDMSDSLAAGTARQYPDQIVGIKVAHYRGNDWRPIDAATKAAEWTSLPVMVDFGEHVPFLSLRDLLLRRLRPGDLFTHCFAELSDREPIVDPATRTLKPFVTEAQVKGILFDVGYGKISFSFSQAIPALKNNFLPNSISSDIHRQTISNNLLNIMSRFLAMGLDSNTVIGMVTWNPAREIHHEELGHLAEDAIADIALLRLRKGKFVFPDHTGRRIEGHQKFECEMTIRNGKIVYDHFIPKFTAHY